MVLIVPDGPIRAKRPFIPYVRRRLAERGIPEGAVDWVLNNAHTRRPAGPRSGSKPAVIYIATYEGRELRVYVEEGSDPPFVKTVAFED